MVSPPAIEIEPFGANALRFIGVLNPRIEDHLSAYLSEFGEEPTIFLPLHVYDDLMLTFFQHQFVPRTITNLNAETSLSLLHNKSEAFQSKLCL